MDMKRDEVMGQMQRMDIMKDEDSSQMRPWADLPAGILASIANRLALLELLSFRGTCKDFRSASSTASAATQSSSVPWLLYYKASTSECIIYNKHESKTYTRKIQELEGAVCLASYQGWLLLFKDGSIFFFCPFSLSKIHLPTFPHKEIDGHIAAFSDLPTSPHCTLTIINRINDSLLEANVISKGENTWTQQVTRHDMSSTLTAATFDHNSQTFFYMDDGKSLVTFCLKDKTWMRGRIRVPSSSTLKPLPYLFVNNKFRDMIEKERHQMDLELGDESVDVCGLSYEDTDESCQLVYLNEVVNVSHAKEHKSKAVWIQPRFFEANSTHHW